jgi:polysaccharide export outer membrane protein
MVYVILILSILVAYGTAQIPAGSQMPADNVPSATANLAFEPVGPGDLVYLSVAGCPEVTKSFRVSAGGALSIPLLAEPIQVAGLVPAEIEKAVARELMREHILISPVVSAMVLEYRSRPVSVVGAVKHPLTLQALGELKLLDAIARSDGLTPEAGPEILVSYPGSGDQRVKRIPVKQLFSGADPTLNIQLYGGEEIRIPQADKLYIVGNVKNPGIYPLNEIEGSSVLKALALSQGLLPYARKEAYVYRTVPGMKDRQEIPVPLGRILRRKSADFPLLADDILYIPDNSAKRLSATVLEKISGIAGSTVSGLVIWH